MSVFINEYVKNLNSNDLNTFSNLIEQDLSGDKSTLLNEFSKNSELDNYLKSATNVNEFYEYLDNIEKAILEEKNKIK
jgi:hypothetical protein